MQQFIDDLELFLILHDEFFSKYPAFLWGIIITLLVLAIIDGIRFYSLRKRIRVYFAPYEDKRLCKYKCYWSKKLRANVIVPSVYEYDFICDTDFIKEYRLVVKK